jgi:uncharacterized membrane protein YkoI
MIAMLRSLSATLMLAAASVGAPPAPKAAAADCVADWSTAAQLVKKENLLTVEQVSASAAGAIPGQIMKTTLCREQGGYVYRLVVREAGGQLRNVVVDAQNHGQSLDRNPGQNLGKPATKR